MAEDKNRLARNVAAQAGAAATSRWLAPGAARVAATTAETLRNAAAYADWYPRIAASVAEGSKALGSVPVVPLLHQVKQVAGATAAAGLKDRLPSAIASTAETLARAPRPMVGARAVSALRNLRTPAAFTWTSDLLSKGFDKATWLRRGRDWVAKAPQFVGQVTRSGRVTGFLSKAVKSTLSRKGFAAGLAMTGIIDGASGIKDLASVDALDSDASFSWRKFGQMAGLRLSQGLLRGLDGMLFGLPSLNKGYNDAMGGANWEADESMFAEKGSARAQLEETLRAHGGRDKISPAAYAKAMADYQTMVENDYMMGKDEYGDSDGADEAELARRTKAVMQARATRNKNAMRRSALLYDYDQRVSGHALDADNIKTALLFLASDHRQREQAVREGDLATDASYAQAIRDRRSGLGGDLAREARRVLEIGGEEFTAFRERQLAESLRRVEQETDKQFQRLAGMAPFQELLGQQTTKAQQMFNQVARHQGYTKAEAEQLFSEHWANVDPFTQATIDMQDYANALLAPESDLDFE